MSRDLLRLIGPQSLRPCPFCGGGAEMCFNIGDEEDPPEMRFTYGVECLECHAGVLWELRPEYAAEKWNRRDKPKEELPRPTALKFAYLMGYEDANAGNLPNTYKAERL